MSEEENNGRGIDPKIKTIKKLVSKKKLTIPDYQRPYKWQAKNVQKLLEDIETYRQKKVSRYRIGTIVIHQDEKNNLNIVDGQQRITTLVLILLAFLNKTKEIRIKNEKIDLTNILKNLEYDHKTSQYNIYHNHQAIEGFIKDWKDDRRQAFCDFLLNNCEVVYIVLKDIDEAFQFFDSQNARGKPLEAYDLLKAFHLREMRDEKTYKVSEKEKRRLVNEWEAAANHGFLKIVFDNLYAIRMWLRGERTAKTKRWDAGDFTIDNVDHFKGINIEKFNYPYLKKNAAPDSYFAIDREIFNGSLFFKYILHYVAMYKEIFCYKKDGNKYKEKFLDGIDDDIMVENLKRDESKCSIGIKEIYESGATIRFVFVTMLFKRTLLFYCDKFGNNGFDEAVKTCFRWSGKLLGKHKSLYYSTTQDEAKGKGSLFQKIKYALKHTEITGN